MHLVAMAILEGKKRDEEQIIEDAELQYIASNDSENSEEEGFEQLGRTICSKYM